MSAGKKIEASDVNHGIRSSMRSNRSKNTQPEMRLRSLLREAGWGGYRLHWSAPGRPDIAYPGLRLAIFVHGCFWHRCPDCGVHMPRTNTEYWCAKFERTEARDAENQGLLEEAGWIVYTVWECRLAEEPQTVLDELSALLRTLKTDRQKPRGRRR